MAHAQEQTRDNKRDDEELVIDYLDGDVKAFSHIVERHKKRLHHVARSYVSQPNDAEDVVQEALLRASQSLHTYRAEAQLATWLSSLVRNASYDWITHRANAVHESIDNVLEVAENPQLAHTPHHSLATAMDIDEALSDIAPEYAHTLYLTVIGGYTVNDLAEECGVAPGTIKSRTARAKSLLKAAMT